MAKGDCVQRFVDFINSQEFKPALKIMLYLHFIADSKGRAFPGYDKVIKHLKMTSYSFDALEELIKSLGVIIVKDKNSFGRVQDIFQLPLARSSGAAELRSSGIAELRSSGTAEESTLGMPTGASHGSIPREQPAGIPSGSEQLVPTILSDRARRESWRPPEESAESLVKRARELSRSASIQEDHSLNKGEPSS